MRKKDRNAQETKPEITLSDKIEKQRKMTDWGEVIKKKTVVKDRRKIELGKASVLLYQYQITDTIQHGEFSPWR